jgi:glutamyl-tRNA reductase
MSVLVVGVSHRTAPVSLLERLTVGIGAEQALLSNLRAAAPVGESVVLSTCNRVEVYVDSEGFHAGVDAVRDLLSRVSGVPLEELEQHLYVHWEGQAVHHLFEVACGLDSMVVGESQILGQLRRAYAQAQDDGAGPTLHELFQQALRVGKRAHTETGIDDAGRSLVTVGLDRAVAAVGPLAGRSVLVVGAGSMGALAGATLRRAGAGEIVVANRTLDRAQRLADNLDGRGIGLDELDGALVDADVVVSSTGATGVVVSREVVERAVDKRGGRPLALLDLALPRDVDPAVRDLPGVTLVDLASLQQVLAATEAGADVAAARAIVTDEVGQFLAWQRAASIAPTVVALRRRAEEVVAGELGRLAARLPELDPAAQEEVQTTVRRVVDKLLHTPTVRVKELHEAPEGLSYAAALRELFGLDRAAPAAVTAAPVRTVVDDGDDGGEATDGAARNSMASATRAEAGA